MDSVDNNQGAFVKTNGWWEGDVGTKGKWTGEITLLIDKTLQIRNSWIFWVSWINKMDDFISISEIEINRKHKLSVSNYTLSINRK